MAGYAPTTLPVPFQLVGANGRQVCSTYVSFTEASLFRRKLGSSGNGVGKWVVCHCAIRIVGALLAAPVFG